LSKRGSGISTNTLIVVLAVVLALFYNQTFFSNLTTTYPIIWNNVGFLASVAVVLVAAFVFLFSLISHRKTIKPIAIVFLLISSITAYFMDSYNIIIDDQMLQNALLTDTAEILDLISLKMLLYFLFLGIVPAIIVYHIPIRALPLKSALYGRLQLLLGSLILAAILILAFSSHYATFFREHKTLRFYTNPTFYIYSTIKYATQVIETEKAVIQPIGEDAHIPARNPHRELIVFVLGETARADRFSLNGYPRETNPLLKNDNVISFSNVSACGTSTAVSVPCIFSIYDRSKHSDAKAQSTENVLDILNRSGVNVLWRDNNSSSKGVALRVPYESYKSPDKNPVCDDECRDEGMLDGLQEYIDSHAGEDMFIVLHQMGNHGPAYYKRYPKSFEKFTPACETSQLEECSKEEIDNAYDNAILYTDYFLSRVIALLKNNSAAFETGMLYVSDHGESLGENGLYLHGLPYFLAPDTQTQIPVIMWFGENYDEIDNESLRLKRNNSYSHDNLFHTILGLMEVQSEVYNNDMDIVHGPD